MATVDDIFPIPSCTARRLYTDILQMVGEWGMTIEHFVPYMDRDRGGDIVLAGEQDGIIISIEHGSVRVIHRGTDKEYALDSWFDLMAAINGTLEPAKNVA